MWCEQPVSGISPTRHTQRQAIGKSHNLCRRYHEIQKSATETDGRNLKNAEQYG